MTNLIILPILKACQFVKKLKEYELIPVYKCEKVDGKNAYEIDLSQVMIKY